MALDRVLIVDDSQVIRRLVEVALEQLRLDAVSVSNGTDACLALTEHPPDLIVLDLGLPDMTGWDVLEFMNANEALSDVIRVLLTGHSGENDASRADALGVAARITKPFRPAEFRRLIADLIHDSRTVKTES